MGGVFGAGGEHGGAPQVELRGRLGHPVRLPGRRFQEQGLVLGADEEQGEPGESGPGADVHQAQRLGREVRHGAEGVQEVLLGDVQRIDQRRQAEALLPFPEEGGVLREAVKLCGAELQTEGGGAGAQRLSGSEDSGGGGLAVHALCRGPGGPTWAMPGTYPEVASAKLTLSCSTTAQLCTGQ